MTTSEYTRLDVKPTQLFGTDFPEYKYPNPQDRRKRVHLSPKEMAGEKTTHQFFAALASDDPTRIMQHVIGLLQERAIWYRFRENFGMGRLLAEYGDPDVQYGENSQLYNYVQHSIKVRNLSHSRSLGRMIRYAQAYLSDHKPEIFKSITWTVYSDGAWREYNRKRQ